MHVNIKALLGDIGVPFWEHGKNVSQGWTSIQCPMGCGDKSNHGAFSPNGNGYSCFKCGRGYSVYKVLSTLTSKQTATKLLKEYSNILLYNEQYVIERAAKVKWPPEGSKKTIPSIHAEYLHKREFSPKQLRELYKIKCCYHTGFMKYRIVIPVFLNNRLVTYVGRDVTNKSVLKYKNLPERKSILPAKETVFNIDAVHKLCIICEGPFDAIRFTGYGVCLWGVVTTTKQIKLLTSKVNHAIIAFDNEPVAQQSAINLAEELALGGVTTDILTFNKKDPGELTVKEAEEIKKMIGI